MLCAAVAADEETGRVLVRLRFLGTLFSTASSEGEALCDPVLGRL